MLKLNNFYQKVQFTKLLIIMMMA